MIKQKKFIIAISALAVFAGIIFTYTFIKNKQEANEVSYDIYEIVQPADLTFSGKVQSEKKQVVIYDQSLGEIASIDVDNGMEVHAGDVLLTYSSQDNQRSLDEKQKVKSQYETDIASLEEELSTAKTRLENAENEIAAIKEQIRTTNTWSVSDKKTNKLSELQTELAEAQQELQTAESLIQSIENSITSYQDMLADVNASIETLETTKETVITADFDGVAKVDENGRTDSSTPVVSIYSQELVVNINVTEYDIEKLALDQSVSLSYVNQAKEITGKISFISTIPESDSDTVASYSVKILMDESIPLGYSVQVCVSQAEVRIPSSSLISEDEKMYVFKYEDGKAVKTEVAGENSDSYFKVTEGLSIGDKIIEKSEGVTDQMEVNAS